MFNELANVAKSNWGPVTSVPLGTCYRQVDWRMNKKG